MKHITEIKLFECKCSKCDATIRNTRGAEELVQSGWLELSNDLLCPECRRRFENLSVKVGNRVIGLIDDEKRGLRADAHYIVCDTPDEEGSVYVDVGNGWQAKLSMGEWIFP